MRKRRKIWKRETTRVSPTLNYLKNTVGAVPLCTPADDVKNITRRLTSNGLDK